MQTSLYVCEFAGLCIFCAKGDDYFSLLKLLDEKKCTKQQYSIMIIGDQDFEDVECGELDREAGRNALVR